LNFPEFVLILGTRYDDLEACMSGIIIMLLIYGDKIFIKCLGQFARIKIIDKYSILQINEVVEFDDL
jgi:hypothetical protein